MCYCNADFAKLLDTAVQPIIFNTQSIPCSDITKHNCYSENKVMKVISVN